MLYVWKNLMQFVIYHYPSSSCSPMFAWWIYHNKYRTFLHSQKQLRSWRRSAMRKAELNVLSSECCSDNCLYRQPHNSRVNGIPLMACWVGPRRSKTIGKGLLIRLQILITRVVVLHSDSSSVVSLPKPFVTIYMWVGITLTSKDLA